MESLRFESFGRVQTGRLVTHESDLYVVFARNPYGNHNLVLVDHHGNAFRHGNLAVAHFCANWASKRLYRRVRRFLLERVPHSKDWVWFES